MNRSGVDGGLASGWQRRLKTPRCGRDEIPTAASVMFALELEIPRREENAMISTRTEAARRIGSSADHRGQLAVEGKMAGDGCIPQALESGSGLAEEPDRHEHSVARIVQSVIDGG